MATLPGYGSSLSVAVAEFIVHFIEESGGIVSIGLLPLPRTFLSDLFGATVNVCLRFRSGELPSCFGNDGIFALDSDRHSNLPGSLAVAIRASKDEARR